MLLLLDHEKALGRFPAGCRAGRARVVRRQPGCPRSGVGPLAAVYLARGGRGTAMLSTALNSNALNIAFGLLLPAAVVGLGVTTSREILVVLWHAGLTTVVLLFAYRDRGLRRLTGMVVLAAYALFVVVMVVAGLGHANWFWDAVQPALMAVWTILLLAGRPVGEGSPAELAG